MATLNQRLIDPETRRAAFEELVRTYTPQLYAQIRRIVLYHDDADDVLQNTFMKAWLALDSYRGDAQVGTWLYRIATNESLTFLQKRREQLSLDQSEAAVVRTLESDTYFDGDELQAQLHAAIAQLPEKQRIVFNLRYFDDMPYEEMSRALNTSVGALKASYHFAVQKLKDHFSDLEL
ncbi:MAG: sigma-70 family RNA polymerase sigma factor [Alloprevotella sp.]|nr:sigma-70 family RNA polymerase sigma factor [Alloprevotella sp.]